MGAPEGEPESRDNERPQRWVKVPPLLIGHYPVTQAEWRVDEEDKPEKRELSPDPPNYKGGDLLIEKANWHDVRADGIAAPLEFE